MSWNRQAIIDTKALTIQLCTNRASSIIGICVNLYFLYSILLIALACCLIRSFFLTQLSIFVLDFLKNKKEVLVV